MNRLNDRWMPPSAIYDLKPSDGQWVYTEADAQYWFASYVDAVNYLFGLSKS